MSSLTAHLVEPGGHGHLPFHPECPVCRRERLAGVLPSEPVVSRRVQAAVAAGVVALGGAAPGAAIAQEPDQQHEGTALPEGGGRDSARTPDFEPGGDTPLPFDVPDQPDAPSSLDTGTPPVEPDANAPGTPAVPPAAPEEDTAPVDEAPAPPEHAPPPPPPTTPTAPPTTAPAPPAQEQHPAKRHEEKRAHKPRAKRPHPTAPRAPAARQVVPAPSPARPPAYAAPPVRVPQPRPAPYTGTASAQTLRHATVARGDRVHVVRPGESLWSIAEGLLGRGASPARVAQEVNRLWELNAARIGTGNPDLVMAGTTLRLG